MADPLAEYYDSEDSPHDALGRAARRLERGALYLGAGVGVEKQGDTFAMLQGGRVVRRHAGPLSAVTHAFTVAGGSTDPATPGGRASVTEPAAAARLRELEGEERSTREQVKRLRSELRSRPASFVTSGDEDYTTRALARNEMRLRQIVAERKSLTASPSVAEAVEVGKPGTNWKQVTADARRRLSGIVEHYRKDPHPFTSCVRDNRKRFPEGDRAERICAVVKDLGEKSTAWHGKSSKRVREELGDLLDAAAARMAAMDEELGEGASIRLAEGDFDGEPGPVLEALAEAAFYDRALLSLAGMGPMPIGEAFGAGGPAAAARREIRAAGLRQRTRGRSRVPSAGSGTWDESKHKRGARGSTQGGKFVSTGSSGSETRRVQRAVGASADGQFGPKTAAAVRAFQRSHGLTVDGVVGHQTALALAGKYRKARQAQTGALKASDRRILRGLRGPTLPSAGDKRVRAGGGWVV